MPIKNNGLYISRWWIPILLGILMAVGSSWAMIWSQARGALPRSEAAQNYISLDEYVRDERVLNQRLLRIEQKIDRLLER